MGNLFIGFPVPRAKIADMISSAAPPLLHAYTHEPGGDDEVTIPPAGMSNPYDYNGYHYKTRFPTLDEFEVTEYQSGAVNHTHERIYLSTGGTQGSYASIKKAAAYKLPLLSYDKDIFIRFKIYSTVYAEVNPNAYIITGGETNQKHIGISIYNLKLCSTVHNGSSRSQNTFYEWGSPPEDFTSIIEIKFYAGLRAEYYLGGELLHTQTEYLPSGWFHDNYFLKLCVSNSDTTRNLFIGISSLELYQPAT